MRRAPGVGGGAGAVALTMRRSLVKDPFVFGHDQWAVVDAVHGGFSSTLTAAALVGASTVDVAAAPTVNDYLVIGTLIGPPPTALQVTAVSGSGPYTVTLAQELPVGQSSGAAVSSLHTLDLYLDGTAALSDTTYLTTGVRYLDTGWTPTAGQYVYVLRGAGDRRSDRVVVGPLA